MAEAAAVEDGPGAVAAGPDLAPGGRVVVVVSGTVTDRLAPSVMAMVDAARSYGSQEPTVISFGLCASSGGLYWDSYAVTKGSRSSSPSTSSCPAAPLRPSRRPMVPPGVPDPTVWGDRDVTSPTPTADEVAASAVAGRVRRGRR